MNSAQSPVLRLLIGGFAIAALGHMQGPVAMATELLAGGPGPIGEQPASSHRTAALSHPADNHLSRDEEVTVPDAVSDGARRPHSPPASESFVLGSDQSIGHLRELVAAMQPDKAAAILEAIPVADAARVLVGLPVSSAVAMLTAMSPEGSALLTEELAKTPD
ncbi:MAG: hypothetical protein AAFX52_15320 [Pseudomonadota bacterium]